MLACEGGSSKDAVQRCLVRDLDSRMSVACGLLKKCVEDLPLGPRRRSAVADLVKLCLRTVCDALPAPVPLPVPLTMEPCHALTCPEDHRMIAIGVLSAWQHAGTAAVARRRAVAGYGLQVLVRVAQSLALQRDGTRLVLDWGDLGGFPAPGVCDAACAGGGTEVSSVSGTILDLCAEALAMDTATLRMATDAVVLVQGVLLCAHRGSWDGDFRAVRAVAQALQVVTRAVTIMACMQAEEGLTLGCCIAVVSAVVQGLQVLPALKDMLRCKDGAVEVVRTCAAATECAWAVARVCLATPCMTAGPLVLHVATQMCALWQWWQGGTAEDTWAALRASVVHVAQKEAAAILDFYAQEACVTYSTPADFASGMVKVLQVWAEAVAGQGTPTPLEAGAVLVRLQALGFRWAPIFNCVAEAGLQVACHFVQHGKGVLADDVAALLGAVTPFVTEALLFEMETSRDKMAVAAFQSLLVTALLEPLSRQLPDCAPWPHQAAAVVAAARRMAVVAGVTSLL